jgi:hypothetical protein
VVGQCWICGACADSREHRFKRTDLARSASTWDKDDQPFFAGADGVRRLQGPKSDLVKFDKKLCQACNTARSQPWDHAYEKFSAWAHAQGHNLLTEDHIDFTAVYGATATAASLNLLRYFAKLLGCRIVDSGNPVPAGLQLVFTVGDTRPFAVSFAANGTSLGGLPIRGGGVLGNYPVIGMYHRATDSIDRWLSGSMVSHLDVIYRYNFSDNYSWEGGVISASCRQVRLGRYDPKSDQPHIANGMAPGVRQRFLIGASEVELLPLSLESWRRIALLAKQMAGSSIQDNLTARVEIVLEIFAGRHPAITAEYLEEHLTIPLCDEIFSAVKMTRLDEKVVKSG